jgi:formylglycine-generating enzyme required for sulfatase activity
MAGNVSEWVNDFYGATYYHDQWQKSAEPAGPGFDRNPQGPEKGPERVYRGGSWATRLTDLLSTTYRSSASPLTRESWLGFRCAKDAEGQ